MAFDEDAFDKIIGSVASLAAATGYFDSVNEFEPTNAPGNGVHCAVVLQSFQPVPARSGLASTSYMLVLVARVMQSASQPLAGQDPKLLAAVAALVAALSGDLDVSTPTGTAQVGNIDALGAHGFGALGGTAGWVEIPEGSGSMYRLMDVTIPLLVNDLFTQAG